MAIDQGREILTETIGVLGLPTYKIEAFAVNKGKRK
jgi:hypothetical protein